MPQNVWETEIHETVSIPYGLFQSFLGRFYMGRTPQLSSKNGHCWGGLYNPGNSDTDVFLDSISLANLSGSPLLARIWINSTSAGAQQSSPHVLPLNAAVPARQPRGLLAYAQGVHAPPADGAGLAALTAGPYATQTQEFGGRLILPPGASCIVFCWAQDAHSLSTARYCEIAAQWWEQPAE